MRRHFGKTLKFFRISLTFVAMHAPTMRQRFSRGSKMISLTRLFLLLSWLLFPIISVAGCIPFSEAGKHIGETKCVRGTVAHVERSKEGAQYLTFCEGSGVCPFAAVIFAADLRHIGDVRQLQGKSVEVHGDVQGYDGRAQIVVSESRQLKGEAANLPPMPKHYDVETRGHYSAGIFSHPKAARSTSKKRQLPTLPVDLPEDSPE
jgi:hypothetical protein